MLRIFNFHIRRIYSYFKCTTIIECLGDTMEREKKRKGSGSSSSVVHWSDFQPSSSESTNRLLNSQKVPTHSSHKYYKQYADSPHRKMESSNRMVVQRAEHRYHPPPEEHPPPVSIVNANAK